jgi:electron transport complex protein RnfE
MDVRAIIVNGLRDQNPGFVQLLGLCPLLAVSTTVASAVGLGIATLVVLATSNSIAALVGPWLPREIRIAVFVVVIAGVVTAVELAMAGWWPALHASLGIFLPLIVTNCLVLARAESFASRQSLSSALVDGLAMGLGFMLVLLALGVTREFLGHGTLGDGLDLLTGGETHVDGLEVFPGHGWLLAILPPGAFILLGLMLAFGNAVSAARRRNVQAPHPAVAEGRSA